jgi:hypothetical protein
MKTKPPHPLQHLTDQQLQQQLLNEYLQHNDERALSLLRQAFPKLNWPAIIAARRRENQRGGPQLAFGE